jgi:hypothetical protein
VAGRVRGSYGHGVQKIGPDHYRLSWTVDRKYLSSRLRFPIRYDRDTDEEGARRFAKRWGITSEGGLLCDTDTDRSAQSSE